MFLESPTTYSIMVVLYVSTLNVLLTGPLKYSSGSEHNHSCQAWVKIKYTVHIIWFLSH